MTTSPAGRKLLEEFEGVRLSAYLDGNAIPTIGFGHTTGVKMGDICTRAQADAFLTDDLKTAEGAVNRLVKVPLNQNQFDALVSITFNIGQGNLEHSTLLRILNLRQYEEAATAFLMWDKVAGAISPGLNRRRDAERVLFLSPVLS